MNFTSSELLTPTQVKKGLQQITKDGLATEAMSCLTEGTFLVALALQLGATNFQIGLLAALPTFTNVFQLAAIRLVQQYKSRKAITVACIFLARIPLFVVGVLPFVLSRVNALPVLIAVMLIHYFFGSIAGASWNAWVKGLVPQHMLGSYFSKRTRFTQTLNIILSLCLALTLNYIKLKSPSFIPNVYPLLFFAGGISGMISVAVLLKVPEPPMYQISGNLWGRFLKAVRDINFRRLLVFNCCWVFGFNIASPFFSVYMMKTMGMPVAHIIILNIFAQLSGIFFIKIWGRYSDIYSNKNIIHLCIPLYMGCLAAWMFTASCNGMGTLILLVAIHMFTGVSAAGINLGLNNIGLKLAPEKDAIVYLASKNMVTALFSAAAPLVSGLTADYFANHGLAFNMEWKNTTGVSVFHLFALKQWNFFFIISFLIALFSITLLKQVEETGEVNRGVVIKQMRGNIKNARIWIWQFSITGLKVVLHLVQVKQFLMRKNQTNKVA